MPRQARLDAPGTLHHVMIRGIEKRNIVDDERDRTAFVSRMGDQARGTGTAIYAWSLLNNHAHLLVRSGYSGLPKFMCRFLTGYAVGYNRRHKRFGHLFQNRYKSIICEEATYFKELVRYIHLNPLRAGLVGDLLELESYPWTGHSVLMDRRNYDWQDRNYVLGWFGKKEKAARQSYRKYVEEGLHRGHRPDLVGGGLIRSQGGWSNVISMRRQEAREMSDERILGSGDFVDHILGEAEERIRAQFPAKERREKVRELVAHLCLQERINLEELQSGSRRPRVSALRSNTARQLVEQYGVPLTETARYLGVTTSAISKMLQQTSDGQYKHNTTSNSSNSRTSPKSWLHST
jgi:putative transposase